MTRRLRPFVLSLATLAFIAGGDDPFRVRVVLPIDLAATDHVAGTAVEAAVQRVSTVLRKDVGLPVPHRFTLYLYDSPEHFEQGLVLDGEVSPPLAATLREFAVGVTTPHTFLLLATGPHWKEQRDVLRLIAHELVHLSVIELAGGDARGAQWLAEGLAEWAAYATIERLGLGTLTEYRTASLVIVREHLASHPLVDVVGLGSPRGFVLRHRRDGTLEIYRLAFAMTDYLIERDGLDAVLRYFKSFQRADDAAANFARAFGQSLGDFEREVLLHLTKTI
jgi:hypothetical protein